MSKNPNILELRKSIHEMKNALVCTGNRADGGENKQA